MTSTPLRQARLLSQGTRWLLNSVIQSLRKDFAVRSVNPGIAKALKTRESSLIEDLERSTRKTIIIQSDPTLHWEQYDIY
jgi:Ribonuclease G/E